METKNTVDKGSEGKNIATGIALKWAVRECEN